MALFKVSGVEVNSCPDYEILGPLLFILFWTACPEKKQNFVFNEILNLRLSPEILLKNER